MASRAGAAKKPNFKQEREITMSVYEKFLQKRKQHENLTDKEAAAIIYELVASDPRAGKHYGIAAGHGFDQFWLYTQQVPSAVLLQATKNKDGSVQLSIQGLRGVVPDTANFLDFFNDEEYAAFMKYLKWF